MTINVTKMVMIEMIATNVNNSHPLTTHLLSDNVVNSPEHVGFSTSLGYTIFAHSVPFS